MVMPTAGEKFGMGFDANGTAAKHLKAGAATAETTCWLFYTLPSMDGLSKQLHTHQLVEHLQVE